MIQMRLLFKTSLAIVVGLMLPAPLVRATDLLTNPGFEADPQGQTSVIFGWNSYGGSSGNVWSETSAAIAHGGTNYLKVYQAKVQAQLLDVNFIDDSLNVDYGGGNVPAPATTQMSGAAVIGSPGDIWNSLGGFNYSPWPTGPSLTTGYLEYTDGSAAGVTLSLSAPSATYDANAVNWGNHSPFSWTSYANEGAGIGYPATPYAALMATCLVADSAAANGFVTLSGLTPDGVYNLYTYNASDQNEAGGRLSSFTVNGVTQTSTYDGATSTLVNGVDFLEFAGVKASAGGNLTMNFGSLGVGESDFNGFQLQAAIVSEAGTYGVYQDNLSGPGAVYAADGWAYTSASDTLAGQNAAWIEVTFRDASANILALYRSALITTNAVATGTFPKNTWIDLPITNQYNPNSYAITNHTAALVAPAGTSFVRYQITFQGGALYSAGSVYFDDLTLTQTAGGPQGNWNIVWSDEFNGASISPTNWTFEIGNGSGGWGNNEQEYYTSLPQNAYVSNGLLHIVGLNQSYDGYSYTSARMKSEGLFTALYGRFAFRVKLPAGQGLWPALWMMPEDSVYGGWAASGEIDVMENIGSIPTNVFGTLHFGGPYPDNTQSYGLSYNFLPGASVTNFNIYLLEWTTNAINWYINGQLYETQTSWWSSSTTDNSTINPYPAPFNKPFYIIMNLAIGGTLGGTINNSIFPCDMQVDYVRLYNLTAPLQLTSSLSGGKLLLTWPSNIVCHLESTTNLSVASAWTNVAGAVTPFSVTPPSTAVFYRLASP